MAFKIPGDFVHRLPLEVWGGVECTVNRVASRFFNQIAWSGHDRRLDDFDRFAALGIRALRFPLLWELFQPDTSGDIDWSWADIRLGKLREIGIRPILGLIHHGSGPLDTSLLEPSFATGLAEFAQKVAERYPWVEDYTPVNEPMTTARFSGLYGLWYPHERGNGPFLRALVNQCRATVLAMQAIRQVQPAAKLIQTEDFGRTYGSVRLTPLVDFLNHRRWLTPDLLCGRVNPEHPLWDWLMNSGVAEDELGAFLGTPSPPDILGLNHYLTSDRFLDDSLNMYPQEQHAQVGAWRFVDTEAVRACRDCSVDSQGILREMWKRYSIPIALTEVHLGCSREEQMRWLVEAHDSALQLRREGVDVRAITAWSMLGSFNWDILLTRDEGRYEPGLVRFAGSRAPCNSALPLSGQHGGWH